MIETLLLATSLTRSPSAAFAEQGRGRGQASKPATVEKADDGFVFDRAGHERVIQDYLRAGALPPGLAKRRSLPPGLAKQLRERGELPPGLQKHWIGVPGDLVARMPPMPPYYHRYVAGDDLVVVDTRDNTIAYLIRNVWR